MLDVHCRLGDTTLQFLCLNEVVVARGLAPRAIHVSIRLDGEEFLTYTADGVLVATATGSTAYSLAAGGPIMYPESPDILITPVAPHLHIGRSMLVPGDSTVELGLETERQSVLSVDGTDEHPLHPRDRVEVCRSSQVARFARLGPRRYFYTAVADRLK
jgi:NAD+ kinase